MHRAELLGLLAEHKTPFNTEAGYVTRAIRFVEETPDCFSRETYPMHITGSAWVVNPARDKVLLVHHGKLDEWFQPGGHADGDHDILRVAMREAQEEAGVSPADVKLLSPAIFDVDMHSIPASRHFKPHGHFDIRFLVEIDDAIPTPGSHESHEVRWVPIDAVTHYNRNHSTYRMLEKTRRLRLAHDGEVQRAGRNGYWV